ncbi:hypothetical protein BV25DRAFT_1427870 [Artomyces pyxidatus]|uniref:Uncharacterized protein n=1 Tax=Artomyces pyxidatus TaxID=48021 RepID=A0ACB8SMV4_9AGAM|nr:hypothetical protein BV25DRAFT_1427870 [Artomyces pyxidatus]
MSDISSNSEYGYVPALDDAADSNDLFEFYDADADAIVRSADSVDFRIYTKVLSKASPVFRTMFANTSQADTADGCPIVQVLEDARTLDNLFRLLYPLDHPPFSIDDLRAVMTAIDKYAINSFPQTVDRLLLEAAKTDPESVYALTCRFPTQSVMKAAAKLTLRNPQALSPVSRTDIAHITAPQYSGLVTYQNKCKDAATLVCGSLDWIKGSLIPGAIHPGNAKLKQHPKRDCRMVDRVTGGAASASSDPTYKVPAWLLEYLDACILALRQCPLGDTVMDPKLYLPSLQKAWSCSVCGERAHLQMLLFSSALKNRVDDAIGQVPLDV